MSLLTKLGLTAPKVIAGAKETVGAPEPVDSSGPGDRSGPDTTMLDNATTYAQALAAAQKELASLGNDPALAEAKAKIQADLIDTARGLAKAGGYKGAASLLGQVAERPPGYDGEREQRRGERGPGDQATRRRCAFHARSACRARSAFHARSAVHARSACRARPAFHARTVGRPERVAPEHGKGVHRTGGRLSLSCCRGRSAGLAGGAARAAGPGRG